MISKLRFFFPEINVKKLTLVILVSVGYGISTIITIYFVSNLIGILNSSSFIDPPIAIKFIINFMTSKLNIDFNQSYLFVSLIFLVSMLVLGLSKLFLISKICAEARHDLSVKILNKILKTQKFPDDEKHQGNLKSLILDEAQQIVKQLLKPVIEILTSSIFIIFLSIYLFFYNSNITIFIFIIFGSTYFINFIIISSSVKKHGHLRFVNNNKRYAKIDDAFNLKLISTVLKTLNIFIEKYAILSKKMAFHQYKFDYISNAPKFFIEAIIFLSIFLLIFYGYSDDSSVNGNVKFAEILVVFSLAGLKILPELQKIFLSFGLLKFGGSSQSGTLDLLSKNELPIFEASIKKNSNINFNKLILNFTCDSCYKGERKILNNIKFKLFDGDKVAIKGKSGAGKTTLINAIMGISPIKIGDGNFFFNSNINFGYVPQETYLFSGSILENITMGRTSDANKLEHIHHQSSKLFSEFTVEKIKDFLDRNIEDVSEGLSVGQKQRIGLLRAIYDHPEVLILDEFTSALDEKNEEIIINFVNQLKIFKSLIIIGHREKSTKICHDIYIVENGNLIKKK